MDKIRDERGTEYVNWHKAEEDEECPDEYLVEEGVESVTACVPEHYGACRNYVGAELGSLRHYYYVDYQGSKGTYSEI